MENKVVWADEKALQEEIEQVRRQLNKAMEEMLKAAKPYSIIGIHNHPGSTPPSLADFRVCMKRKYKCGVVVCHDGKIYKYSVNESKYDEVVAALALARLDEEGYNINVKRMFEDSGIDMEVL